MLHSPFFVDTLYKMRVLLNKKSSIASSFKGIYYMDLKQQLTERLETIEILSDFDLHKRMGMVNASLCKLFGVLDVLKNMMARAGESKSDINISPQAFEQVVTILEGVGLAVFLSCNAKKSSLEKIIQEANIDRFLKEYSKKENYPNG